MFWLRRHASSSPMAAGAGRSRSSPPDARLASSVSTGHPGPARILPGLLLPRVALEELPDAGFLMNATQVLHHHPNVLRVAQARNENAIAARLK